MAIFISGSDETFGKNSRADFTHGGWVGPEEDWAELFAPAWEQRVLAGPPRIPFLHMTDLRDPDWRMVHGITDSDAGRRIDAAVDVISEVKSLFPVSVTVSGADFRDVVASCVASNPAFRSAHLEALLETPDYLGLMGYMLFVLALMKDKNPGAERVDFLVERKQRLTHWFQKSHDDLPGAAREMEREDLVPLIGTLVPQEKPQISLPVQAADLLCWYRQRKDGGALQGRDVERFRKLGSRVGIWHVVPKEQLADLADRIRRHAELERGGDGTT